MEVKLPYQLPKGTKVLYLGEIPRKGGQGLSRMDTFGPEWEYEELDGYVERLLNIIWEEQYPDESLLKQYLDFKVPRGTPIPTSIRVPQSVIEIINAERKLGEERRRKEVKEYGKASGLIVTARAQATI